MWASQPIWSTSSWSCPADWYAEEVGDAVLAGDRPHLSGRVDQATVGRDVVERDQLHRPEIGAADGGVEGIRVDLSVLVRRHHLHDGAGAVGDLEVGDHVGAVFGLGGEDAGAGGRGMVGGDGPRVEKEIECGGAVDRECDLVAARVGTDQPSDRWTNGVDSDLLVGVSLVSTDAGFKFEVLDLGLQHRLGRKRRPGVVEVDGVSRQPGVAALAAAISNDMVGP